jgi:hypothetical protein
MTTLAISHQTIFDGAATESAGMEGRSVAQRFWSVVGSIKGATASASGVFDELDKLAREQGTTVAESALLTLAQRFLLVLPGDIPAPEIDLDNDGDILFDWHGSGLKMFTLALAENGRVSFAARLSPTKKRSGSDQFLDSIPQEIAELVRLTIQ